MDYRLESNFLRNAPQVVIIGCGGTGGFVAESMCRLLTGREASIFLVDHDIVEPHNLLRQNFYRGDVGRPKSQVLAERLAYNFNREIAYSTKRFENTGHQGYGNLDIITGAALIIGCVDNAEARRSMAELAERMYYSGRWLIDAGNGDDWGQVLIGNSTSPDQLAKSFNEGVCSHLPVPTLQRPDLLTQGPTERPDVDCAAALDLTDQSPVINQMMATLVMQAATALLTGACRYMNLHVDMAQGTVTRTLATPENMNATLRKHPELLKMVQASQENPHQRGEAADLWDEDEPDIDEDGPDIGEDEPDPGEG